MLKTANLQISTWVGSSVVWYAEHYYATIKFGDKKVDVTAPLTKAEAARLNKGEEYKNPELRSEYKVGEESGRFTDEKRLIKRAIELFEEDSYGYDALLLGDVAVCDPQEMIAGPCELMARANYFWRAFEDYNGWDARKKHWPALEKISKDWEAVVGNYFERSTGAS